MTRKALNLKIYERRHEKLRLYALSKEKTMTQLIEDWIDRLPTTLIGDLESPAIHPRP
ncbi:MAG: hypothetical protein KME05_04165 [Gloeocapsa sp. UFS-A4-WI-NPMV-4B04]|jgi:hypothetical protein|nr:hypothetical protein [Gloeocapsa sp. UFS-A4-WI-NPMV-4B04]